MRGLFAPPPAAAHEITEETLHHRIFVLGCVLLAVICNLGDEENDSSSSTSSTDLHVIPADEMRELKNLPSLRSFSESEKEEVINAANKFQRAVKRLEEERGY